MISIILYLSASILLLISLFKDKSKTKSAIKTALTAFENIMPQFLGIIVMIGMILSILDTDTISKLIGNSSGLLGILLSSVIGSITIMPTFVAFSTGNILLRNGAGLPQVGALISTLTMVGILTFSLEASYIGKKAAFLRNFFAFLFSFIVALFIESVVKLI